MSSQRNLVGKSMGLFTTNVPGELAEAHGVGPSIVLEEQCLAAERAAAPCGVDGAGDAASAPGSGASVCEALLKARAPPNWKEASVGAAVVEASAVVVKVVVLAVVVEIFDVLGLASTGAMAGFAQSLTFAQSLAASAAAVVGPAVEVLVVVRSAELALAPTPAARAGLNRWRRRHRLAGQGALQATVAIAGIRRVHDLLEGCKARGGSEAGIPVRVCLET
eukprot:CAMPEP_0180485084 /NCGR_PEP_ID=MMETSP1036_2-20121128/36278_1 /TAXON_ID=632150 /ORGANISM="Azadinium spinosum, Strain 3D9" /LENGTH=220 /DNA_ID=CAMNT_0022492957 /DNA_START=676 /DNA_END=1336 /DNA_ORIENTATION=+